MSNAICKKCGHKIVYHLNKEEGYRCHEIKFDKKINDSVQCECRLVIKKKKIAPNTPFEVPI